MKKLISLLLALTMVMSLAICASAAEEDSTTYTDMSTVTLTKEYKLANADTTSPAETFTFSALTCTSVTDAAEGVTTSNAPVPTVGNVSYSAGEAGGDNAEKTITISLPDYNSVGIYTYTFTENDGGTAGVTYRSGDIKLVVTVIEQDGKVRVAAVHTEEEGAKSSDFDNTYSAGSLSVTKNVTGIMGDQQKEFTVKVTFTAPNGDTVREAISYTDGTESKTIKTSDWTDGKAEVEITLKHEETVTFTNIPYGVTYTVEENDYTEDGYEASYDKNQNGEISAVSASTTITNNKDGNVDTGVSMDSIPYVILIAVCAVAAVAFVTKRRRVEF